ncbi:IS200/IS605 family element transposase accessory protein TnpB [Nocardia cyriacigeorgica]|uniref:IS200/IS605 family element transposase accessory protein TnpB n=1 Tax=Nocardia cyriacigeorgica TaxID=135487 RepID=A0A6P1CJX7_9NOCA|nr:RNA-guided endonuclease TnpB family protein [Nocardia cyriacigeorgica]NEW31973.1 IS200/IS605 family element transposase accessory protein TnpB [Nocardia cyriacigeorgica]
MARHTTFKFCLDPTTEQQVALARHAGAARFAFNQCLRTVKTSLAARRHNPDVSVPWTGFDLINAFNAWKKSEDAGRVFAVGHDGVTELVVTGLAWRTEVRQQVFEEAAVDCGRALATWSASRSGERKGRRVGFPKFKKKTGSVPSFRLRNNHPRTGKPPIRIGEASPRSVTLPGVGRIAVRGDTRRLRRMIAKQRAKILFATISHRAGRWWVTLNVEAVELHPGHRHARRDTAGHGGWVGVDRGLNTFLVAADDHGHQLARVDDAPRALATQLGKQRRLARALSRKKKGSNNQRQSAARLSRHHHHIANMRRHFLHKVSNELVQTHDRIVIEDLNVAGMLRNRRLARAISDAAWAEFARMLGYKSRWRGGTVVEADRWYPSSQICSVCEDRNTDLTLADRVFTCSNGHQIDRDTNAAVNLARWATLRATPQNPGPPSRRPG